MKTNPCPVCKQRNVSPTSKRGFCSVCQQVVTVIDYLVAEANNEAERVAKREASGLILPKHLREG